MMYLVRFILPVLLSFGFCLSATAQGLRSHDATYAMKQVRNFVNDFSPLERAEGVLRYKIRQTCDGWAVEHHTAMHMDYVNSQQIEMKWNYTSWEAKDGSMLRFRSRTQRNGEALVEYVGVATRTNDSTVVTYSKPHVKTEILPKETYFPTQHLIKSIALAQKGETVFNASYFDGSGEDLGLDLNTFIAPFKGKQLRQVKDNKLAKTDVWDMHLAFFEPESQASTPEMEIGARYRKDGVSTRLLQDFGDFVLKGQLVDFSYAQEPSCTN